ncbi:MAG: hypothetical protein ACI4XN_12490 [Candidatus Kurthia intestinigallinarum]
MINLEPDELLLYFGDDYVINEHIMIKQPTVGKIIPCEKEYFSTVYTLTAIPSDMKSQLWDLNLDWNEIEPFELFQMLAPTLPKERTQILFGDLDFTKLKPYRNNQNGNIVLADKETGIVIDEMIYTRIVNYLRKLHHITPKVEKTESKTVKKWLIEEDRNRIKNAQNKPFKSYLLPIISSVKVKQGYTKDYMRNMGFYELMDEVERLNIIVNSDALLHGMYSGMIDTKKIDKKELNWMREL